MSSTRNFRGGANRIASHMDGMRSEVLSRWRDQMHRDQSHGSRIRALDDRELKNHLPALIDQVLQALRSETVTNLDENAAEHGRQRRTLGISVVLLSRELQILRHVLSTMA